MSEILKTTIRIANPEANGKKYTSSKRALEYVKSGRAVFLDDGSLFFGERRSHMSDERIVGDSRGYEYAGTPSGRGGPSVMQLTKLRDRGITRIQQKRGISNN